MSLSTIKELLQNLFQACEQCSITENEWKTFNQIVLKIGQNLPLDESHLRNCTRLSDSISAYFSKTTFFIEKSTVLQSDFSDIEERVLNDLLNVVSINEDESNLNSCTIEFDKNVVKRSHSFWHKIPFRNKKSFLGIFIHLAFSYVVFREKCNGLQINIEKKFTEKCTQANFTKPFIASKTTNTDDLNPKIENSSQTESVKDDERKYEQNTERSSKLRRSKYDSAKKICILNEQKKRRRKDQTKTRVFKQKENENVISRKRKYIQKNRESSEEESDDFQSDDIQSDDQTYFETFQSDESAESEAAAECLKQKSKLKRKNRIHLKQYFNHLMQNLWKKMLFYRNNREYLAKAKKLRQLYNNHVTGKKDVKALTYIKQNVNEMITRHNSHASIFNEFTKSIIDLKSEVVNSLSVQNARLQTFDILVENFQKFENAIENFNYQNELLLERKNLLQSINLLTDDNDEKIKIEEIDNTSQLPSLAIEFVAADIAMETKNEYENFVASTVDQNVTPFLQQSIENVLFFSDLSLVMNSLLSSSEELKTYFENNRKIVDNLFNTQLSNDDLVSLLLNIFVVFIEQKQKLFYFYDTSSEFLKFYSRAESQNEKFIPISNAANVLILLHLINEKQALFRIAEKFSSNTVFERKEEMLHSFEQERKEIAKKLQQASEKYDSLNMDYATLMNEYDSLLKINANRLHDNRVLQENLEATNLSLNTKLEEEKKGKSNEKDFYNQIKQLEKENTNLQNEVDYLNVQLKKLEEENKKGRVKQQKLKRVKHREKYHGSRKICDIEEASKSENNELGHNENVKSNDNDFETDELTSTVDNDEYFSATENAALDEIRILRDENEVLNQEIKIFEEKVFLLENDIEQKFDSVVDQKVSMLSNDIKEEYARLLEEQERKLELSHQKNHKLKRQIKNMLGSEKKRNFEYIQNMKEKLNTQEKHKKSKECSRARHLKRQAIKLLLNKAKTFASKSNDVNDSNVQNLETEDSSERERRKLHEERLDQTFENSSSKQFKRKSEDLSDTEEVRENKKTEINDIIDFVETEYEEENELSLQPTFEQAKTINKSLSYIIQERKEDAKFLEIEGDDDILYLTQRLEAKLEFDELKNQDSFRKILRLYVEQNLKKQKYKEILQKIFDTIEKVILLIYTEKTLPHTRPDLEFYSDIQNYFRDFKINQENEHINFLFTFFSDIENIKISESTAEEIAHAFSKIRENIY